jgi:hypothetical protein
MSPLLSRHEEPRLHCHSTHETDQRMKSTHWLWSKPRESINRSNDISRHHPGHVHQVVVRMRLLAGIL